MIRRPTLQEVGEALVAAGKLDEPGDLAVLVAAHEGEVTPTPLVLQFVVAVGAWIAAAFLLGWLTCGIGITLGMEGGVVLVGATVLTLVSVGVGVGAGLMPRALAAARRQRGDQAEPPPDTWMRLGSRIVLDFVEQAAVAGTLAGHAGIAFGLATLDLDIEVVCFAMFLQSVALVAYPHLVVRYFATCLGFGWLIGLAAASDAMWVAEPLTVAAVIGLAVTSLGGRMLAGSALDEVRVPVQAGFATMALMLPLAPVVDVDPQLGPLVAVGVGLTGLVAVVLLVLEAGVLSRPLTWVGLVAALVVAGVTWQVPGVVAALLVLAFAARGRQPALGALGVTALVVYGWWYWFQLGLATWGKTAALMGTALAFAVLFLLVRERVAERTEVAPTPALWRGGVAGALVLLLLAVNVGAARGEQRYEGTARIYVRLVEYGTRPLMLGSRRVGYAIDVDVDGWGTGRIRVARDGVATRVRDERLGEGVRPIRLDLMPPCATATDPGAAYAVLDVTPAGVPTLVGWADLERQWISEPVCELEGPLPTVP